MALLFTMIVFYGVWRYCLALFELGWNIGPLIEAISPWWYRPMFIFIR